MKNYKKNNIFKKKCNNFWYGFNFWVRFHFTKHHNFLIKYVRGLKWLFYKIKLSANMSTV